MSKLEQKLTEAQAKSELLIAKHRRSRALTKASQARIAAADESKMGTFDRMKNKIQGEEAMGQAMAEMASDNVEEKLLPWTRTTKSNGCWQTSRQSVAWRRRYCRRGLRGGPASNGTEFVILRIVAAIVGQGNPACNGGSTHSRRPCTTQITRIGGGHVKNHFDPAARAVAIRPREKGRWRIPCSSEMFIDQRFERTPRNLRGIFHSKIHGAKDAPGTLEMGIARKLDTVRGRSIDG